MGRRITRKQLKGDEFVSSVEIFMRWFVDNWRPFAAGLGVVGVLVLIWWGARAWSADRADSASQLLDEAVTAYQGEMATGEVSGVAEGRLEEVVDRYPRTDQADMARLYLARILMGRGELDGARDILVQITDDHRRDALGRVAALDLVRLRIESGQAAAVAQELEEMVVGRDQRLPRDVALYQLGVLYRKEQQPEQAREYFQKLVDEFPESPYLAEARRHLTELG